MLLLDTWLTQFKNFIDSTYIPFSRGLEKCCFHQKKKQAEERKIEKMHSSRKIKNIQYMFMKLKNNLKNCGLWEVNRIKEWIYNFRSLPIHLNVASRSVSLNNNLKIEFAAYLKIFEFCDKMSITFYSARIYTFKKDDLR